EVIPGVTAVALGSAVPMDGIRAPQDNVLADTPGAMRQPVPPPRRDMFVSPGYMQTLRIPFVAGRDFDWTETSARLPVAIVSESFAREYWTTAADALGKRIRRAWGSEWREIVGVVGDVRADGADKPAGSAVYWPLLASGRNGTRVTRIVTFAVRSP